MPPAVLRVCAALLASAVIAMAAVGNVQGYAMGPGLPILVGPELHKPNGTTHSRRLSYPQRPWPGHRQPKCDGRTEIAIDQESVGPLAYVGCKDDLALSTGN